MLVDITLTLLCFSFAVFADGVDVKVPVEAISQDFILNPSQSQVLALVSSTATSTPQARIESRARPPTDALNQTRCYCQSPDFAVDHRYGSYLYINYYNFHLDRDYKIELICNSDEVDDHDDRPLCLRDKDGEVIEKLDEQENRFWYKLDYLGSGFGGEKFGFNHQKRGISVPEDGIWYAPRFWVLDGRVREVCEPICEERVGGMSMVTVEKEKAIGSFNWSRTYYNQHLADMCDGCK